MAYINSETGICRGHLLPCTFKSSIKSHQTNLRLVAKWCTLLVRFDLDLDLFVNPRRLEAGASKYRIQSPKLRANYSNPFYY